MKKLLSILCTGLLLCGAGLTSCENYDDPVTGNAYGNNSIPEGRTISIAALKEKYNDFIDILDLKSKKFTSRLESYIFSFLRIMFFF